MNDVDKKEAWKDVVGYEGLYKVSNFGNVYSCYVNRNLKPGTHRDGYKFVILTKNKQEKYETVHRLVAEAFIPNPYHLPVVNHKDEDPSNNSVYNLEWCTQQYNATYNDVHIKRGESLSKTIYAYDKTGRLHRVYSAGKNLANDLNMTESNISTVCNSDYRTYGGYVLSYKELTKQEVLDRFKLNAERKFDIDKIGELAKKKFSKPCARYTMDDEYIDSFPSAQEAGRQLNINSDLISGVCRGEHEYTHGYKFKYI